MIRRLLLPLSLLAVSAGGLTAGGLALAQGPLSDRAALALAQRQAQEAAQRSQQFEQAAEEAGSDAERLRAEAEALVAGIEASEARISAAEARVRILNAMRAEQRARLAERQQPLIHLTAALQTMARRPPALALVQPGSIEDAARVRALLASTLPLVRERTVGVRAEIASANRLRAQAERAVRALAASRDELRGRRVELARLEQKQRERSSALAASALRASDRSIALGEEARDIAGRMSGRAFQTRIGQDLAALPAPLPRPGSGGQRVRQPPYRVPVEGRLVSGFGEISEAGIHSRGLVLDAAAGAAVIAPRAARVAYAGRFRSYGEVVILDHGGGWTTTITNLEALRVAKGDTVRAGDPIGRAGAKADIAVELRRNGRPQSIASFIATG